MNKLLQRNLLIQRRKKAGAQRYISSVLLLKITVPQGQPLSGCVQSMQRRFTHGGQIIADTDTGENAVRRQVKDLMQLSRHFGRVTADGGDKDGDAGRITFFGYTAQNFVDQSRLSCIDQQQSPFVAGERQNPGMMCRYKRRHPK